MPDDILIYWASDDLQLRQEGDDNPPVLSGTVVRYGDTATVRSGNIVVRERMEPGVFGQVSDLDVMAVLQHERSRGLGRTGYGLTLSDTPTALRADLTLDDSTDGKDALIKYRSGILRGFSAEFRPVKSKVENGVLIRQQAQLIRIGVVDKPAYPDSVIELRQAEILALSPPPAPTFNPWR